ncbi:MAG: hypothetical protein AMXMBFR84_38100 [Candidatus Hydrogenedentota bacterium]
MSLHNRVLALLLTGAAVVASAQTPNLEKMDIVMKAIPNGPVAIVNQEVISAEEYRDLYLGEVARWADLNPAQQTSDEVRIGIALGVLRELIERTLLKQEAVRRKLTIPEADLDAAWNKQMDALRKAMARKQGRSETDLPTEDEVLKASGGTKEAAREELREALMIERARTEIIKERGVTVTDEEVTAWYEKFKDRARRPDMLHVKQIYFAAKGVPDSKKKEAERKATEALQRILAGQSFEGVAKNVSEGAYKEQGGDWGMQPAAKLPVFIREAAMKMKPGDTSAVISSEYGYHIIKLVDSVPGEEISLEEAKDDIRRGLMADKGANAVREFCNGATADSGALSVYLDIEKQLAGNPKLLQALQHMFGEEAAPAPQQTPQ